MSIQFKDLKITTMTLVFLLNGTIDIRSTFHLLPITKVLLKQHRESKKCELPVSSTPGAILSMRYKENDREMVRGIVKNNKKSFKNSITLDISTTIKNLSLKISPTTIQLCGAPSRAAGTEATYYIIEHLKNINDTINYIHENPDLFEACLEWMKVNSKGPVKEKIFYQRIQCRNVIINVQDKILDNNIIIPSIPEYLDSKIMKFLCQFTEDMFYYGDYISKISYIQKFPNVFKDDLSINKINEVMVNYNYNLGFKVNRDLLNKLIDGRNGLYSHYDSAFVHCVTIELPYDPIPDYTAKKQKKEIPHHTFLVYYSGACTQSGPCSALQPGKAGGLMEEAFNIFIKTIDEIKDQIKL
jgi:hypothetical protein